MAQKEPTFFRDGAAALSRGTETGKSDEFNTGCNKAGSCAPGIGINIDGGVLGEDAEKWTLLDQDGAARTPQVGQHIGGSGLGDGVEGKGTVGIDVGTIEATNDGNVTVDGQAQLTDLATGWTSDGTP